MTRSSDWRREKAGRLRVSSAPAPPWRPPGDQIGTRDRDAARGQQVEIADDHRKVVVETMRQPAGQPAYRVQPLGFAQLLSIFAGPPCPPRRSAAWSARLQMQHSTVGKCRTVFTSGLCADAIGNEMFRGLARGKHVAFRGIAEYPERAGRRS